MSLEKQVSRSLWLFQLPIFGWLSRWHTAVLLKKGPLEFDRWSDFDDDMSDEEADAQSGCHGAQQHRSTGEHDGASRPG